MIAASAISTLHSCTYVPEEYSLVVLYLMRISNVGSYSYTRHCQAQKFIRGYFSKGLNSPFLGQNQPSPNDGTTPHFQIQCVMTA
eukprot:4942991-Pleurochrysis_carterae.AAC.1